MFRKSAAIPLDNGLLGDPPKAVMELGGVTMAFPMINVCRGNQGSRLQADVSLGGDVFIAGSVQGVGTYILQFWDAPILGSASDYGGWQQAWYNCLTKQGTLEFSAAKQLLHMTKLKDRIAVVKLFQGTGGCGHESQGMSGWIRGDKTISTTAVNAVKPGKNTFSFSSTPMVIFKGVVTDMQLELVEQSGVKHIITQLTTLGAWGIEEPKFAFSWI